MTRFFGAPSMSLRRPTHPLAALVVAVLGCAHESTGPAVGATHLVVSAPPASAVAGAFLAPAITVTAEDASGSIVTSFAGDVTLALGANPGGSTLSGSLTEGATAGIATFSSVVVDKAAAGYTFVASSGSLTSAPSAAFAIRPVSYASLAAGPYHTCGVAAGGGVAGGEVFCWGDNRYGGLGDGTTTERPAPTPVAGGLAFRSVAAGNGYTCGLTAANAAFCWGDNGSGNGYGYGELGDGTTTSRTAPVAVQGATFGSVVAGEYHSCALTPGGTAYCWGSDTYGQLGDGTPTAERSAPVAVQVLLYFSSITVGDRHSCAVTAAGAAYCWGFNGLGELGDGTTTDRSTPVAVQGGIAFTSLAAGFGYACGMTAAGVAYCWGDNSNGELGDGTTTAHATPAPVAGGLKFASLVAREGGACGLIVGGAAYCWGRNPDGELGDGTTTQRLTPTAVAGSLTFASLTAGDFHACGLTTGGTAYCWGDNTYGELGDRTTVNRSVPTAVIP